MRTPSGSALTSSTSPPSTSGHLSTYRLLELCEWASQDYRVEVMLEGNATTKCVVECWTANPDAASACECPCAGTNDGSGTPPHRLVPVEVILAPRHKEPKPVSPL